MKTVPGPRTTLSTTIAITVAIVAALLMAAPEVRSDDAAIGQQANVKLTTSKFKKNEYDGLSNKKALRIAKIYCADIIRYGVNNDRQYDRALRLLKKAGVSRIDRAIFFLSVPLDLCPTAGEVRRLTLTPADALVLDPNFPWERSATPFWNQPGYAYYNSGYGSVCQGTRVQLGNAADLHAKLSVSGQSGSWYETGTASITLFDADGVEVGKEIGIYRPGEDFNETGGVGTQVDLSKYPTAASAVFGGSGGQNCTLRATMSVSPITVYDPDWWVDSSAPVVLGEYHQWGAK